MIVTLNKWKRCNLTSMRMGRSHLTAVVMLTAMKKLALVLKVTLNECLI